MRYVNCGHQTAFLLRRDNSLERLDSTCTVLGLFREWECSIEELRLSPGDVLVLYTDGITEACNEADEDYGEQRLIEILERNRRRSSREILTAIIDDVRAFSSREQRDDIVAVFRLRVRQFKCRHVTGCGDGPAHAGTDSRTAPVNQRQLRNRPV